MMITTQKYTGGGTHRHNNNKYWESKSSAWIQDSGDTSAYGNIMGTITQNAGSSAPRNGFKIIEIIWT